MLYTIVENTYFILHKLQNKSVYKRQVMNPFCQKTEQIQIHVRNVNFLCYKIFKLTTFLLILEHFNPRIILEVKHCRI